MKPNAQTAHIAQTETLEPTPLCGPAGEVKAHRRQLGKAAGGQALGCSHIELLPGCSSWPAHVHFNNEEAIYVLSGQGTLRLGARTHIVRAGDYIAIPAGPDLAHEMRNETSDTLVYLCMSTMNEVDISFCPDLGTVGVFAGAAPGGDKSQRHVTAFLRSECRADYWTGKPKEPPADDPLRGPRSSDDSSPNSSSP